jgi:integrase
MKGVNKVTVSGRIYYYDRRTGERLPDDEKARRARMLEIARGEATARKRPGYGTIAELIATFRGRPEYLRLAANSRRAYGRLLDSLMEDVGTHQVSEIDREFVVVVRDSLAATPRTADMMIAVLRRLLAYAVERPSQYRLAFNPAIGVKRIGVNNPYQAWPDALVDAFRARAYPELRLAMELGLGTGQRISDCAAMLWSQYDGRTVRLRQQKTKTPLVIPASRELIAALTDAPRRAAVILTTRTGRPWRADHLRPELARVVRELGFPGYSFHGLRKRTGALLAEAGCTEREIMAVLGHKSAAMARLYTEAANQERLAAAAVTKLERRGNPDLQNPRDGQRGRKGDQ